MSPDNVFAIGLKWFYALFIVTIGAVILISADISLRSKGQDTEAIRLMDSFGLSWVVLAPDGSSIVHPEMHHPGVDLRFSPQLPLHQNPTQTFSNIPQPALEDSP